MKKIENLSIEINETMNNDLLLLSQWEDEVLGESYGCSRVKEGKYIDRGDIVDISKSGDVEDTKAIVIYRTEYQQDGTNVREYILYSNGKLLVALNTYSTRITEELGNKFLDIYYTPLEVVCVLDEVSIPKYDKLLGKDTIYNKEYNIGDIVDITIPDVGSIKGVILHVYKESTNDKSKGDNGEDITRQLITYHCAVYANSCVYEIRFLTHSIKHFYCGFPPYDGEIIGRETKISEYYTQFKPKYVRTIVENCTIPKYDELLK